MKRNASGIMEEDEDEGDDEDDDAEAKKKKSNLEIIVEKDIEAVDENHAQRSPDLKQSPDPK